MARDCFKEHIVVPRKFATKISVPSNEIVWGCWDRHRGVSGTEYFQLKNNAKENASLRFLCKNIYAKTPQCYILANNQLDEPFYVFIYFVSLHVSNITVLIIRRSNCINTSSGMIRLCTGLLGMPVSSLLTGITSSHLHRIIIPYDVLIQFDLLMMSTVMLETCRETK